MVKSHKSFLISLILVSIVLISICAVLFFAQETAFADPTYTVNVYENDNDAVDRKGALLGPISNVTQVTHQDFIDANLEELEAGYDYNYYLYDEDSENKLGELISDMPVELHSNIDVIRLKTITTYKITWKNTDDSILDEVYIPHGTVPAFEGTPTYDDAQYTYTFNSWSPTVVAAVEDAEYKATYTTEIKKYTIRFIDFDNDLLEEQAEVEYGQTPVFGGTDPTRPADAQFTYAFSGWDPTIIPVTGDATYKAIYSTTINSYTVTWKNYDDTVLETDYLVPYGDIPKYDGEIPRKDSDGHYTYTFSNWSPTPIEIKGDTEYKANYSMEEIDYFVSYAYPSGDVIKKTIHYNDSYGEVAEPKREGYKFINWTYEGQVVDISGTFKFTEDILLYPTFEANEYTLIYSINNEDVEINVTYDQENIDLKTEKLDAYLENNIIFGFYEVKGESDVGDIVAQNSLIIPKMTYSRNMRLNFISIPKAQEYITTLSIPRLEGYQVDLFFDGNKLEKSSPWKMEEVGHHTILIKAAGDVELYNADIVIKEEFSFEDGDIFEDPIKLTYVNAKVYVDEKEVDPTTYRIDKNGTHTIKVVGANGYENTYSITYNNTNIIKSLWLIGISSVALVIFIVLLALGRRRVVKYGSDRT